MFCTLLATKTCELMSPHTTGTKFHIELVTKPKAPAARANTSGLAISIPEVKNKLFI